MEVKKYYLVDPLTKKFVNLSEGIITPFAKTVNFWLVDTHQTATAFESMDRALLYAPFLKEDREVYDASTSRMEKKRSKKELTAKFIPEQLLLSWKANEFFNLS